MDDGGRTGDPARSRVAAQERQRRRRGGALLAVDAVLLVDGVEQLRRAHRLRRAQDQEAARPQGIVEGGQQALLVRGFQVDEDVAAGDEVEPREWGIADEVVLGEDAQVAHRLVDLVVAVQLDEEPGQPLGGDVGDDVLQVHAGAGLLDRLARQVGAEDEDGGRGPGSADRLQQADGDRVGLLARRAAGDPDPHRRIGRPVLEDPGGELVRERVEGRRVAEERRHVDEQVLVQPLDLAGILVQPPYVLAQAV